MTARIMTRAQEVSTAAAAILANGPRLRACGLERRCNALAAAAAVLRDASSSQGARVRELLPDSTGLSRAMIDWALDTTVGAISGETLLRVVSCALEAGARRTAVLPRLAAVVLAGNVFTAAVRPIFLALAAGVPVVCKASSRDDVLPNAIVDALADVDGEVGAALGISTFPGGSEALEDALFENADVVIVYGSDETVHALRTRVSPRARLLEHGHGISVAWISGAVLGTREDAAAVARQLATDIAAYDQRGCLSPQIVFVQRSVTIGAAEFARQLHLALAALEELMPRGALPADIATAQMQWRGTMIVSGELHEGSAHAVAYPDNGLLRPGPGWRNVLVVDVADAGDLARRVTPFGIHLKSIGIAGGPAEMEHVAMALPSPLCPRLCAVGEMQTPAIDAFADGAPPLEGMVRWIERTAPSR